jgi:hypothetical protein
MPSRYPFPVIAVHFGFRVCGLKLAIAFKTDYGANQEELSHVQTIPIQAVVPNCFGHDGRRLNIGLE